MAVAIPATLDSRTLLAIGIVILAGSAAMLVAVGAAAITNAERSGVALGTMFVVALYVLITRLGVPITLFSPLAFGLSALVIAIASLTALVRVSRAEI